MAALNFRRRRTRHGWYVGATLAVFALMMVLYVGGAGATLSGSPYNGTDGSPDAGITAVSDDPSGSTDNSFGQGTKEDNANVTVVSGSIPPNKNDLTNFYENSTTTNSGVFLYLGWTRAVNIGNANLDFEINKHATTVSGSAWSGSTTGSFTINRTNGDFLVTYDFGGSGTPTLGVNRWLAVGAQNPDQVNHPGANTADECLSANSLPCWGDHVTLGSSIAEGSVSSDGLFGEAVINLTGAGIVNSGTCDFGQATTFLKSRSSSSFTAELKDFIAPVSTPVAPCATLTVIKRTLNPASSRTGIDAGFTFTPSSNLNGGSTFTLNDAGGATGDVACPATKCNKQTFTGLGAGTYTATESDPTPAYALTSISCKNTGTTTDHGTTNTGTRQASVTLALGDDVTCVFTNTKQKTPSSLTTAPWIYPNDSARVSTSQQSDITGTVTFRLFQAAGGKTAMQNCQADDGTNSSAGMIYSESPALSTTPGASKTVDTDNHSVKVSSTAVVVWNVSYGGDTLSVGRNSVCAESIDTTLSGDTTGGTAP